MSEIFTDEHVAKVTVHAWWPALEPYTNSDNCAGPSLAI